ncbi:MAG: GIY-YIG nuclease family protein [Clostridiales bacterium]|jgi:hypothetical protein|nr:GIY-YIG nuclease family protein [Clostridiales bacterium]
MDKKELRNQYKTRVQTGGVYAIKNLTLNQWYVDTTADLAAAENRFRFFGSTHVKVERDYKAQNGVGFAFEVLEELKKKETQTEEEFKADLAVLKEIWLEKLGGQALY